MSFDLVRDALVGMDVPAERVVPEATLESLGVDSLMLAELLWQAEEQLGVTLDKVARPVTVGDLVSAIEQAKG